MKYTLLVFILFSILGKGGTVSAQEDPGRTKIGKVQVTVYFATNADPKAAGDRAEEISTEIKSQLQSESRLKFSHYRAMGADTESVFRSYENWAQPLKPSDEVLVRFETRRQPMDESLTLDLELWLARKKILKTEVLLKSGRPLYVLGPEWRGGNLIVAVALAQS